MDRQEKRANRKQLKKERRLKLKEERRNERILLKEKYANASAISRFLHVNAKRMKKLTIFAAVIVVLLIVCKTVIQSETFSKIIVAMVLDECDKVMGEDVPLDILHAQCPIDEEGEKRIDDIPSNDASDTWTFCVYMVGANLEDYGENDLSPYVSMITKELANENSEQSHQKTIDRFTRYKEELESNGLDLPGYVYKVTKPTEAVEKENEVRKGAASSDITEMTATTMPDNVTIVIQTGGATRWSNVLVNPNKTQRFVIKDGIFSEDESLPIEDSCNPDTLADFMSYCNEKYAADHMGLILWDHGGGVTGYGVDSITNSRMSLKDLNYALSKEFEQNIENPYFDFIGFDACLMATTDTAAALEGYGKYLIASEEVEPGYGWDYKGWLSSLAEDTTMSAAKIGQRIADSYMDSYTKCNNNFLLSSLMGKSVVTFSVVDINKAAELDDAYEEMNSQFLKLISENPSVLTDMSRAASKTIRYAGSLSPYFGTIDLGDYIDFLSMEYPDECENVRRLLKEAVLYKRSNYYLSDSQGLSVYFPTDLKDADSLLMLLNYVYEISDKPYTNALYYYKASGCLNEEMDELVTSLTGKDLRKLNTQIFYDFQKIVPSINSENEMYIDIGEDLKNRIQNECVELVKYDEDEDLLTYYGTDDCCEYDENGGITAYVDGKWFALDGSFLDAEFSFRTEATSTYVAKVLHNDVPSYMTFTFDSDTEEVSINSVVKIPDSGQNEYDAALRVTTQLCPGDSIVPVLRQQSADGHESGEFYGEKVKYKTTTEIKYENLPAGDYLQSVVISDLRGDRYYSPVVESHINNGKSENLRINPIFVGVDN